MVDEGTAKDWTERAGRLGLAARGVVYCLMALVTMAVATGRSGEKVDREGALRALARQGYGTPLLALLAVGFAGYAAWRFLRAATGASEGGKPRTGFKGAAKRLGDVGAGAVYISLLLATVRLLTEDGSSSSGGDGNQQAKSWSARFMVHGWGRGLVIAVGIGLVAIGAYLAYRGLGQHFEKHLRLGEMNPWQRTWLPRLGTAGYAARGVVAALVGVFLLQAAIAFDPAKAEGVDGALHRLAQRDYGPPALALVALGVLGFGLFSFVEARWRKVLEG